MMVKTVHLEQYLFKYFQLHTFREGQKEIIRDVLQGKDVLGVLPTGSGKSICYQLPAMMSEGVTIVVSPLIALMIDQVKRMKAIGLKRVAAFNSFLQAGERMHILQHLHEYKLLFVSPETLQQKQFLHRICQLHVNMFVIDEAHCISQWGFEFRPDYMRLGETIEKLGNPTVLALSATATDEVQRDIIHVLKKPDIVRHIYPIDKENLVFMTKSVAKEHEKLDYILSCIGRCAGPVLIYFSSRQTAENIASSISASSTKRVAAYHGGLEQMDRLLIQQQFMLGQLDVICCTSAFGMGIDKSDIRMIIHYHMPPDLKSYIQEAGRAGRDGKRSLCLLLYEAHDEFLLKQLIDKEIPSEQLISHVLQVMKNEEIHPAGFDEASFIRLFDLTESQWHFFQNQFEKHDMMVTDPLFFDEMKWKMIEADIQDHAKLRRTKKNKRIYEMLSYVHTDRCLRESLYKHFQPDFTHTTVCCDHCGFSFADLGFPREKWANTFEKPWKQKLQDLLLINDEG